MRGWPASRPAAETSGAVATAPRALLHERPEHVGVVLGEMESWLAEHEYDSVEQMKGSMSQSKIPNPVAFAGANYAQLITSFVSPYDWRMSSGEPYACWRQRPGRHGLTWVKSRNPRPRDRVEPLDRAAAQYRANRSTSPSKTSIISCEREGFICLMPEPLADLLVAQPSVTQPRSRSPCRARSAW
jgi:hypothetical protein